VVTLSKTAQASPVAQAAGRKDFATVATGGYVKDLKDMPLFRDGVPAIPA